MNADANAKPKADTLFYAWMTNTAMSVAVASFTQNHPLVSYASIPFLPLPSPDYSCITSA